MSFISIEFVVFFAIVVCLYFLSPPRRRLSLLLISSYIFYAFSNPYYVLLILFSTSVDYVAAGRIGALPETETRARRTYLLMSIATNLGMLFIFKYFNFFGASIQPLLDGLSIANNPFSHELILPVGISFYTFQSMAYTIDVYRGNTPVERNPAIFATYVVFFPQLVAGPIERANKMLPQFRQHFQFDYDRIVSGFRLMLWGMFKKVVIADRLSVYVNAVYNDASSHQGITLILATVFFAYQIYCDFSGYSDIAIGAARVLGFDLMENFRHPYLSKSVREFWRRWHISLSTWFRDYLYIPLGGNRVSFSRNLLNLFIVFVVSGLWHGASWTFVIWGALHGLFIIIETVLRRMNIGSESRAGSIAGYVITFALVMFAWIFFRANSLDDALYIITHLTDFSAGFANITQPFAELGWPKRLNLVIALGLVIGLQVFEFIDEHHPVRAWFLRSAVLRWSAYYLGMLAILITLIDVNVEQPFIYFQF